MTLVASTGGGPAAMVDPIRRGILSVDAERAGLPHDHADVAPRRSRQPATGSPPRWSAPAAAWRSLLATLGVYGVIAYAVARRTREMGIRLALGARPPDLVRLILSEGLSVMAAGIALGLVAAAAAATVLGSALPLYGVNPTDPTTYLTVPVILVVVAIIAALPPTQRALRLDPNAVLRQD